jgi:hypothetical protein
MGRRCFTVRILYRRGIESSDAPTEDMKSHYQQTTGPDLWLIWTRAPISCNFSQGNTLCSCNFFLVQHWTWCSKLLHYSVYYSLTPPVPVAAESTAWVWCRSPAEFVGSNTTGGMDVCLLWMLCVVRGLCDWLITHPEEFYQLSCFVVCDLETSWMRRPWPSGGCRAENKQTHLHQIVHQGHYFTKFRRHISMMHTLRRDCTQRIISVIRQHFSHAPTTCSVCDATPYWAPGSSSSADKESDVTACSLSLHDLVGT